MTSGGPNAPRWQNGNIHWARVYNEYLRDIIANQKAPNTVRGLMYILESKGVLKKSDYKTLDKYLLKLRLDHYIEWNQIADGSGRGIINDHRDFEDPDMFINSRIDFLKKSPTKYREYLMNKWRWHCQPKYVTFMVEKNAITGTMDAYLKDHYVKIAYNRGNNGWGFAHRYVGRMRHELYYTDVNSGERKRREEVYLWYLGDSDKYGKRMDRGVKEQIAVFGASDSLKFKRIAVLPGQEDEYNLIESDERDGYEIDALNAFRPDLFERLLLDHVDPYFDKDIHSKMLEKYPESEIDKVINRKVQFLDHDQDNDGIATSPNAQTDELDDEYSEEMEDD